MATIGNFGKLITFEVSSEKMLALKDLKRTVAGRWKKHEIVGAAPRSEFQGPDLDETTITAILSAEHGVKPRATIERLEAAARSGEVDYLIIGGKRVGTGKVYISSISEEWDTIWNKGELVKATINITFAEYA
jgi:phage protein U